MSNGTVLGTAILGGGPAGLSVAHHLKKRGHATTLFEASATLGGACQTKAFGGFRYDMGAHRFHNVFPEVAAEIRSLLEDDPATVSSPSHIYHEGKPVPFPPSPLGLARALGFWRMTASIAPLLVRPPRPGANFRAAVTGASGENIATIPHVGHPPRNTLRSAWASQASTSTTHWNRPIESPYKRAPDLKDPRVLSPQVLPPIDVTHETHRIAHQEPFAAFRALRERYGEQQVFLLESLSGPARDVRSSLIGFGPLFTLEQRGTRVQLGGRPKLLKAVVDALAAGGFATSDGGAVTLAGESGIWGLLRAIRDAFAVPPGSRTSFRFGYFGYFGYDIARAIERLPQTIPAGDEAPTTALALFEGVVEYDARSGGGTLTLNRASAWDPTPAGQVTEALARATATPPGLPAVPPPRAVRGTMKRSQYLPKVEKALDYIRIGDIYQVQIGHQIDVETDAPPLDVYQRMRQRNPSPYMYLAPFGELSLVGASPESFIKIEDGLISMRPIAGTIRRGATPEEDARLVEHLKHDEKELAEHVMLVDLCRNDIGRVCQPGTLNADELLIVEQYSHVNHLVSNVTGRLRTGLDAFDAITATFPAGTMTGAPKIRAMEIIEELEHTRRGAYAGAVGLIDFAGHVNMALCIRSAIYRPGRYTLRASAGTVADSNAEKEWRETLHKMGAVYWSVAGEELADESFP